MKKSSKLFEAFLVAALCIAMTSEYRLVRFR